MYTMRKWLIASISSMKTKITNIAYTCVWCQYFRIKMKCMQKRVKCPSIDPYKVVGKVHSWIWFNSCRQDTCLQFVPVIPWNVNLGNLGLPIISQNNRSLFSSTDNRLIRHTRYINFYCNVQQRQSNLTTNNQQRQPRFRQKHGF